MLENKDWLSGIKKHSLIFCFALLLIVNMFYTPHFCELNTIWNLLNYSLAILLVAMGMNLVIALGSIDISVGAVMALSAAITAQMFLSLGIITAVIMGIVAAVLVGAMIGWCVSKYDLQPIIITLAMMIAVRGVAQIISQGKILIVKIPEISDLVYYRIGGTVPVSLLLFIFTVAVFYFLVKCTVLGRMIEAVGDNKNAAVFAGINVLAVTILVFAINACMAGISGIYTMARLEAANPNALGLLMELDAIAAVAVGGTNMNGGRAQIINTTFGVLLMQLITATVNMNNWAYSYSLLLKSAIIVLAVYVSKRKAH